METTNLVVDQVMECNDTPDQGRQVYHQHHVICFHCTKEMEIKAAVVRNIRKWKDQVSYGKGMITCKGFDQLIYVQIWKQVKYILQKIIQSEYV